MTNTNITNFLFLLVLWLSVGLLQGSQAQTVDEYAAVDSLKVGDTFDFSIVLNREREYDQIIFPDSSQLPGDYVEIRSRSQYKVTAFKDSVYYQLQFFATADTLLPELPVLLVQGQDTTVLHTTPVPLPFHSVLAQGEDAFRPLKPIFEFALAWWPYILAIILLCLAAYLLYSNWTKEEDQPAEAPREFSATPFENPLKVLQQQIARLEKSRPATHEEFKIFYIDLGDAIRRYFEDLHHIPALESTSREIIQSLQARSIDRDLIDKTRSVLQEADMVKFAHFTPSPDQAEEALRKAQIFLRRAKEIDSPRVEHLRRQHQSRMEAQRERFEKEQNTQKVDV
ncbi:hypothetical protein [Fodinibius sediminis]|uniref:Protein BatD n=1 Tax=Fodinibius sediminis TaxID=1214077 RepID=A0A521B5Z3_9BACT|nr:hypothetical protein [Fodinibius sediminis]SMO42485.1 hypothetical protein SAMN06265218_102225 [Fodinibius sediminis]